MNHYGLEQTYQIREVFNHEIVLDQDDFKDKIEQVTKTKMPKLLARPEVEQESCIYYVM